MARRKKVITDSQVFKLPMYGPHAKVTIEYDVEFPPPFFQPASGVVIVGEHVCALSQVDVSIPPLAPRGGNLLDVDSPEYQERVRILRPGQVAPPGYSPRVETSEMQFGMKEGEQLNLGAMAAASQASSGDEGE